ncbi:MAG: cyclically-permuted mutarotase family protein [Fusobacteriaceae bacterium]
MKKMLLATGVLSLALMGCSSAGKKIEVKDNSISWKVAGNLPAPQGYEKQFGVAAPLYGVIGEHIIIAGGANFPKGTVLEGGPKTYYPDLFVLKEKDGKLEVVDKGMLPFETAHGSSVTAPEGIYYIGGNTQTGLSNKILLVAMENGKIKVSEAGELPFTINNATATYKNGKLYILPGSENGKPSKKFYEFDLATKKTSELETFPGEMRSQAVSQILAQNGTDRMYVFSGMSPGITDITKTDGYFYDFATGKWAKAADIIIKGAPMTVAGGASVKLNSEEMLVIGGVNKQYFDNAVYQLGTLKGEELQKFRQAYFGADAAEYKFNREIVVYNSASNSWRTVGETPFMGPAGPGLVILNGKIFSINGETKAGIRSEKMYVGTFE